MSKSVTPTDDSGDVVSAFKDAFDSVAPFEKILVDEAFNGHGWIAGNNAVTLIGSDCTRVGMIDMDCFENTEYVETTTLEHEMDNGDVKTNRVYGFTVDGETNQYVRVEYVRTLANEVFNVEYSTIRSWARTTTDESCMREGDAPVLFDIPDSEYRVVVLPVITS